MTILVCCFKRGSHFVFFITWLVANISKSIVIYTGTKYLFTSQAAVLLYCYGRLDYTKQQVAMLCFQSCSGMWVGTCAQQITSYCSTGSLCFCYIFSQLIGFFFFFFFVWRLSYGITLLLVDSSYFSSNHILIFGLRNQTYAQLAEQHMILFLYNIIPAGI